MSRMDGELVASLLEEAVHLQHIVDDLQDLALADAGLTLTTVPSADPAITADPVRLRQALDNLVSNAVRHTPRGGSITVSGRREGDDVVFEVADTGEGISAENLPHVFDRFWLADPSRSRSSGGSGLGLAIVRNLVEAHGGTVAAASTPGHGTTFTLRFPADPASTPPR